MRADDYSIIEILPDVKAKLPYTDETLRKIAHDIALEIDDEDVCATRHGVPAMFLPAIKEVPAFKRALKEYRAELNAKGVIFKSLCRETVTNLLHVLMEIAQDEEVAPASRIAALDRLAKWGGVDNSEVEKATPQQQMNVQININ
jgi:hypothetical protein